MGYRVATWAAAALLAAGTLSGCGISEQISTSRAYNYATVTHTSQHLGATKSFNENNPGFGIGSEAPIRRSPYVVGLEAGRYRNSLDDYSSYAAGYVERKFAPRRGPKDIGLGLFLAYAEYPSEVQRAKDKGYLTIGDLVPVVGLQATVATVGPHSLRMRLTPGLSHADAVLTVQSNFRF